MAVAQRLEAWITCPDELSGRRLARALRAYGGRTLSGPYCALLGVSGRALARPWTLVADLPAGIDPTLLAAVVAEHGCAWVPGDGSRRWTEARPAGWVD